MSEIRVDTISEKTSANGVAIDGVTLKDGAITSTAATTITVADNSDNLTLTSTDADANVGPNLRLYRNSSSPADNDALGFIEFEGRNDNSQDVIYGSLEATLLDASDGTEDGELVMRTMIAGTKTNQLMLKPEGFIFNENSADLDFRVESNGNANMLFVDGGNDKVGIGTNSLTGTFHVLSSNAGTTMYIEDSHAGDGDGPELYLYRSSASPADNDSIGIMKFLGRNDNSQDVIYGQMQSIILDASDGTEDAKTVFNNMVGGSSLNMLQFDNTGVVINESSNDIDFRVEGNGDTHAIFMNGELDHTNFGSSDATLYQVDIKDATDFDPSNNTANSAPLRVRSAASTGNLGAIAIGGNNNNGIFQASNNFITLQGYSAITFHNSQTNDDKFGTKTEIHRMELGNFYWNRISQTLSNPGMWLSTTSQLRITVQADDVMTLNREGDDGNIVLIRQANATEGTISVSGSTVSYNGFTGTHWSRLADNSKPTILRGTIMESINTMMDWYQAVADVAEVKYTSDDPETKPVLCEVGHPEVEDGTANIGDVRQAAQKNVGDVKSPAMKVKESITLPEGKSVGDAVTFTHGGIEYNGTYQKEADIKHVYSKISDTADSTKVYGLFNSWDEDEDTVNDMIVAQVGTFIIRVNKDVTVEAGDLLVSNGDGTAKKQEDDIIRSKTVAKVNSNVKIETYSDGSYTVPCTLHC